MVLFAILFTPALVQTWAQPSSREDDAESRAESAGGMHIGRNINDFRLKDYRGKTHALSDFSESEIVVVAFLGTECPLVKLYGSRLATLAEQYKQKNVAFIGINSNQQDTPTEMGSYARRHGISFPLLKDPGNLVADQFHAVRTPEVFVLDKQRTVQYWGRIDDQFGVGYARPEAKRQYLVAAVNELLAGDPVSDPQTESVGCHIGRVSRVTPSGDVTYATQISRIMQRRCVECHRDDGIAPFCFGVVRRRGRLGRNDRRSHRGSTHAPLARQSKVWTLRQ